MYTFDYRNEKTLEGKFNKFFDNATHYFTKITNNELYTYRNILEYVDGRYILTNPITEENISAMRMNMSEEDVKQFDAFLEKNWKIKPQKLDFEDDITQIEEKTQEKKRGRKPKNVIN